MSASDKMLKTAGFMAAATFLAKACGLVRESLITAYFGTGNTADAYFAATQLPTTMFDMVIGGVISASFIPVFNSIYEKENKENAMSFANRFIGMILLATIILSAVGIIFSRQLISGIIATGFSADTAALAAKLSSIMFPMVIFTGLAFSFVGILQSFGEFNIPAIMSLVSNVAVILYFPILANKFGVFGLSVAILFSWSLQVFIQIPSLKKIGYRFLPRLDFRDKYIKQALLLALPMLISTWVQPLYSLVNTRFASSVDGAVTVLNQSNRLYLVMTGVFSFVVTNLIFPRLSRTNAAERTDEAKALIAGSLKAITMVIMPIMVCFILLREDVIGIIYERGKFTREQTIITAAALACYSTGMIGLAYNEILSKAFFSMKNSKTPMITALCSMAANILLAWVLFNIIGTSGLALATAGGSTVNAILNFIAYRKKCGKVFNKQDISELLKTIASAATMAVVIIGVDKIVPAGEGFGGYILHGAICGAAGLAVYLVLAYLTGIESFKSAVGGVFGAK